MAEDKTDDDVAEGPDAAFIGQTTIGPLSNETGIVTRMETRIMVAGAESIVHYSPWNPVGSAAAAMASGLSEAGQVSEAQAVSDAGNTLGAASKEYLVVLANGAASPKLLMEIGVEKVPLETVRVLAGAELQTRAAAEAAAASKLDRWQRYALGAGGWIVALGIALLR